MAESNETTNQMSAKTRAARIRKDLAESLKSGFLSAMPVERITVKTNRASLMTAIDVKIHMTGPARIEVPDPDYGTVWKLTDDALSAVHFAEDIGHEHGATEWADGRHSFFTVEAVEHRP